MKRLMKSKVVAVIVLVAFSVCAVQCGYILYPERKGQSGGSIDVPVLVMDCLWLIVGIVPGVVALVVDFVTGCIYEPAQNVSVPPGAMFSFRIRDEAPVDARVAVTIRGLETEQSATLLEREVSKGEIIDEVMFNLPEEFGPGAYELAINVNDRVSAAWTVTVE